MKNSINNLVPKSCVVCNSMNDQLTIFSLPPFPLQQARRTYSFICRCYVMHNVLAAYWRLSYLISAELCCCLTTSQDGGPCYLCLFMVFHLAQRPWLSTRSTSGQWRQGRLWILKMVSSVCGPNEQRWSAGLEYFNDCSRLSVGHVCSNNNSS